MVQHGIALRTALAVAGAVTLVMPDPAAAQAASDTVPPPAYEIDPVIVHGFGVPARMSAVPFSAAVVTPRTEVAGATLDEALIAVPGVQIEPRFNFAVGERISVRGFGSRAQFGVRGARVLVDGIPATFADGQTVLDAVDPGRLRRVEVVRGPAAAFHGNAAGGVLGLETERPEGLRLGLSGGGVGLARGELSTAGAVGAVGLWGGGSWLAYDGYRPHSDASIGRISGGAGWTGALHAITLVAHGSRLDARNPGSLSAELLSEDRFQAFRGNVAQATGKSASQLQLGGVWRRTLGSAVVESGAHLAGRSMQNPIPGVIIDLERIAAGFRSQLRSADDASIHWRAGVEADAQWDDRLNHRNLEGERGERTLDQAEHVVSAAHFGSLTVPLGPLLAHGSLRYDRVHFRVRDRFDPEEEDDSGARSMGALSPAVGLVLGASSPVRAFASYSTSFETPTTTELANRPDGSQGFNPDIGPQRTRSFEVGAAAGVGRLSAEVVAFHALVEDALVPFQVDGGRDFFRNAGSALHRGVELVGEGGGGAWRSRISASLLDARFRDYAVGEQDHSGNRVPGVARATAEGFVERALVIGTPRITLRYRGAVSTDDANTETAPAHLLVDAAFRAEPLRLGRSCVTPWIELRNLTDEPWIAGVVPNAFGGRFYEPGPGRRVDVGVSVELGGRE